MKPIHIIGIAIVIIVMNVLPIIHTCTEVKNFARPYIVKVSN